MVGAEIALYDDDPFIRMSYPDLIEEDGELYLFETQKDKARGYTALNPDWACRDCGASLTMTQRQSAAGSLT